MEPRNNLERSTAEDACKNMSNMYRPVTSGMGVFRLMVFAFAILIPAFKLLAQPEVQLGIGQSPAGMVEFKLLADGDFDGIISGTIVTLRWVNDPALEILPTTATHSDTAMAAAIGPIIFQGFFNDGIYAYATWATIGNTPLGAVNALEGGQETPFFTIQYINASGACIDLEVVDDQFQLDQNLSWYISLGGVDKTGGFIPNGTLTTAYPDAICQDLTITLEPGGHASMAPDAINAGFIGCSGVGYSTDQWEFSCADVGMNTVTLTTNANGRISTCSATITVNAIEVDADGDGVLDCDDACPLDPLKWLEPGICGCGEVDIDTNNNGICDALEFPPNVKLGVIDQPNEYVQFHLLPDDLFNGIVSNTVVTVRWYTSPDVMVHGQNALYVDTSWNSSVGAIIYAGTTSNGSYSYATWVTLWNTDLGAEDAWEANEEVPFFQVPYTNTSGGCVLFEVLDDSFQQQNNLLWYISLSGEDKSDGYIAGKEIAGSAAPGTSCDDGNIHTLDDEITVDCSCSGTFPLLGINLKVILDGPYDETTDLMRDDLRAAGLIPLQHPFSAIPFGHTDAEMIDAAVLDGTGPNAIVDWVLIELRSAVVPSHILASRAALLQRDGDVVDLDGISPVQFTDIAAPQFFVAVRHRNHLGVMTGVPVQPDPISIDIDLTFTGTSNYGSSTQGAAEAQRTRNDKRMLWAGNVTGDSVIKYTGSGNDRDAILAMIGSIIPTLTVTNVYAQEDVDLNGIVQYAGSGNDKDLILLSIGGDDPTSIRPEQLP